MILSFSNLKGGVGKTHITILATLALVKRGYKVLIKDFDPQGTLSEVVFGWQRLVEFQKSLISKYHFLDLGYKLTWLALERDEFERYISEGVLEDIIKTVETPLGSFDVFPTFPKTYADAFKLLEMSKVGGMDFLRDFLHYMTTKYDFIIFDLPPQPIPPTRVALKLIDVIIPPVLYGHESTVRPVQLLLTEAFFNDDIVLFRNYMGKYAPIVLGTIINMVTKKQVDDNYRLKPGLPFLKKLSWAMADVYNIWKKYAESNRREYKEYLHPSRYVRLIKSPYLREVPIFMYSGFKRIPTLKNYIYALHSELPYQMEVLDRLVSILEECREEVGVL